MDFINNFGFLDILFVFAFSGIAWLVPIQGGIGAYHWIVANVLVIMGLSMDNGLYFATVVHGTGILVFILAGIISLIMVLKTKVNK